MSTRPAAVAPASVRMVSASASHELLAFICRVLTRLAQLQAGGRPARAGRSTSPQAARSPGIRRAGADKEGHH
jgi:hypothetical protein